MGAGVGSIGGEVGDGSGASVGEGPLIEHPHCSLVDPQKPSSEQQSEVSSQTPFPLCPPPHVPPEQ